MNKKYLLVSLFFVFAVFAIAFFSARSDKPIAIILSPHLDDAVLPLGGFLAKREYQTIVTTFLTQTPQDKISSTTEYWNRISGFATGTNVYKMRLLEDGQGLGRFGITIKYYKYPDAKYGNDAQSNIIKNEIEGNITDLISEYKNKPIYIYGPATFGPIITHPGHELIHQALIDIYRKYAGDNNVKFFMYEDFPYIDEFIQAHMGSLIEYITNTNGLRLVEQPINLSPKEVLEKVSAIEDYKSQVIAFRAIGRNISESDGNFDIERCKNIEPKWYACEMTYQIVGAK